MCSFWKFVSNLDRRETRRYLQMFYTLMMRPLIAKVFLCAPPCDCMMTTTLNASLCCQSTCEDFDASSLLFTLPGIRSSFGTFSGMDRSTVWCV